MPTSTHNLDVYLEVGKKRVFACAVDWPGWCRLGRDEHAALQALADSAPRYARVLHDAQIAFEPPADAAAFVVGERLEGNTTTDFGAPDVAPHADAAPIDETELARLQQLLQAYWRAFDAAVQTAGDRELRKGPRGGGRDVEGIARHVLGAEANYLARLAWPFKRDDAEPLDRAVARTHAAALQALAAAARGDLPTRGPRGGAIWLPRYFVRRAGWHVLDHVWEIEDRLE